jgi:hypothetical protein
MTAPRFAIVAMLAVTASMPVQAQRAAPKAVARTGTAIALTPAARSAAIDQIIGTIEKGYVFPDRVPAIVARLKEGLTQRYDTADPSVFAERVTTDLRAASNDRHMYLNYAPDEFAAAGSAGTAGNDQKESPALAAIHRRTAIRANHGLARMDILPGNVRYLKITGFEWVDDQTGAAYDSTMRFLRDGDAVIIDLRGNGGGSHAAVRYLLSHFMDGDTLDMTFLQAGEPPSQSRTLEYLPAGRLKGKPLYVLIDHYVGSAAEAFAYDVQQFRLGTLIGATTAGAANNNRFSPIAPGFMLSVSFGRPVHPISQSNWEKNGVSPDVAIDPGLALDTAQSLALASLAARPNVDAGDRADWQWARIAIDARLRPPVIAEAKLRSWTGVYGTNRIGFQNGGLTYQRTNGQVVKLVPLTADGLFSIEGYDDHLRVRLTGDAMERQWIDEPSATRIPKQ